MKIKAPCKDCEKRYPGCHSHCAAYKAFRAELDRVREAKMKEGLVRGFLHDSRLSMMKKTVWRR